MERAHSLHLPALGLSDRNGVYGIVRAHVRAKELGIPLFLGAELHVAKGPLDRERRNPWEEPPTPIPHEGIAKIVALATSEKGYANLCKLLSRGQARCDKGDALLSIADMEGASEGLELLSADPSALLMLREAFGTALHPYCARHMEAPDKRREGALRELGAALGLTPVGGNEVLYHDAALRPLQDVVACIREGVTLRSAGNILRPNAEHGLLSAEKMRARFSDAPELLDASVALFERCQFSLDSLRYRYPEESIPNGLTEQSWLRELTFQGARKRYPEGISSKVRAQLERELNVIRTLGYGGYFLTMVEIVEYCRQQGILCQGRGSAANSAVCFCLGITAVNPEKMDLLFERFLSVERAEPPDIDLDIEHQRREEVIQHVYQKYGRSHAAMVANVIRYRAKSAVREVGKVLGVPLSDLDALSKLLSHYGSSAIDERLLESAGLKSDSHLVQHLMRLTGELRDAPRHLSVHPGGFLLGDRPVNTLVPIEPATMVDRTVIQWDKYDVEALGLFKVDLLGLGALTCVRKSLELLEKHNDLELELATIPEGDSATYEMVSRGDTIGVFQIESRAQMSMLPRLKPRCFYDLVIEVAIVRPGPIQGDMVHPYLRRRSGKERVEYPHPKLKPVLQRTLGVPIFQEQVMKVAVEVADYTPGEADRLRRDMAAWKSKGKIDAHHERMVNAMIQNGIEEEFAERVFSQVRGFGEYGFPESHAASFALIAYATAWLRCHHPAAFTCALLNSLPMGFYSPATLVEDVKRHGVRVRPIDIHQSEWDHTLVRGHDDALELQMGFRLIKGLSEAETERLSRAREERAFESIADTARRAALGKRPLELLAAAGAFGSFKRRRDALWEARAADAIREASIAAARPGTQLSFSSLMAAEEILWDYRSSQHSARGHPMAQFRNLLRAQRRPSAKELNAMPDASRVSHVGMVICRQRPITASGVTFFTLEDETGSVNVVVWQDVFERHLVLAKTASVLGIAGTIQQAEGTTHLVADRLFAPKLNAPMPKPVSRDFH